MTVPNFWRKKCKTNIFAKPVKGHNVSSSQSRGLVYLVVRTRNEATHTAHAAPTIRNDMGGVGGCFLTLIYLNCLGFSGKSRTFAGEFDF